MKGNKCNLLSIMSGIAILGFSVVAIAAPLKKDEAISRFMSEFQKGAYVQALDILNQVSSADKADSAIVYWSGMTEFKLQKYDSAAAKLSKVVQEDKKKEFLDAPYVLGQSYYASKNFKKARVAFKISAERQYKVGASNYYIGYIQNLLNEDDKALESFKKVLSLPESDSEMKQPASFQIGEIHFERGNQMSSKTSENKEKQKNYFLQTVIPLYEKTIELSSSGDLSGQARGRITEIKHRFGAIETAEVPRTASGAPKPVKAWVLRLTQDFKYDSNIINQPDGKLVKVSFTGSPLSKTAVFGKYEHIFDNWIVVTPELNVDATIHLNRRSDVYSNDNAALAPAVRTRLDHTLNAKPAAGLFEYEYSYGTRDYKAKEKPFTFYNQSHNIIVGERFEFISPGSTTLKGSSKFAINQNSKQNFIAPKVSLTQNWGISKYTLATTASWELQIDKDPFYDQRSYAFNNSIGFPGLIWETGVDLSLNITLVDTMHQYDNRGLEKNIVPGITFTRHWDSKSMFSTNLNYNYTRNISADKPTYDYSKHVVGVGLQVTF